ncbi:MAG: glycosyltransferase [Actinomycetota bacterium]
MRSTAVSTRDTHGVLVTYRRPDALADHLGRLSRQSRPLASLTIVDNDDDPAIASFVARSGTDAADRVRYVGLDANVGPAGGFRHGVSALIDELPDEDVIVLLDDDDPPWRDDTFERLVDTLDELRLDHPDIGGVGVFGARLEGRGRLRVDDTAAPAPVHYLSGAGCPHYTVGALRSAPGPDPDLFFGFEELDLGLALRRAGHTVWSSGLARDHGCADYVRPSRAALGVSDPSWRRYYSVRNLITVLRRDGRTGEAVAVSAVAGLGKPMANLVVRPRTAWANLRLTAPAVLHAWWGRLGRRIEPAG